MAKRRGRPTVAPGQASVQVKVSVPDRVYAQARQCAAAGRVRVADVMRDALRRYLDRE